LRTKSFIFLLLILSSHISVGQTTYRQTLYWIRYQNQLVFSPKVSWSNDIDNRRFIGPDVQNQLIFHSRIHYKFKRWDFGGGITYSLAFASIPEAGYKSTLGELRPVIEVSYEIPIGKIFFAQRVRMDNRFFQEDPDVSLLEDSYFVRRFRYRAQLRLPLRTNEKNITTIGLRLADEIMVNDRENFYDQNRIYVSTDFLLSEKFTLETGYVYIHQQRFRGQDYFSRHVLRLSLVHKIRMGD
jgi:hypothetical protein